jgi:Dolichyl-phosphate-mannose-protein mannosyltransferase
VYVACAASLLLGLFFVFVWAPHPWGWEGIDHYHDFGLAVARGESFPTTDYPWGYAYYLAPFYRAFGDRPWIPLVVQVSLNALAPLLVYAFARTEFDERVAIVAALLTGFLSFNTVYASTQSSDSVCNVIFVAAILVFARARRQRGWLPYLAAGILLGITPQFRPNLILVPLLLAVFTILDRRTVAEAARASLLVCASISTLVPWIVHNYRLTGEIIPTSTRGTRQLWYGTLQSGAYLKSRAYNPRSVFEDGSFPYTSLDRVPLIVTGRLRDCATLPVQLELVYWTDRDAERRRITARWIDGRAFRVDMPPSPAPTVYYFYFDGVAPSRQSAPYVYFVSADHLGDMDTHGDVLDVFDLVRMMRQTAWGEPATVPERLDLDGDNQISKSDVHLAVDALLAHADPPRTTATSVRVDAAERSVILRLGDGSSIAMPREWSGRITDIEVTGALASALVHATVPFSWLRQERIAAERSGSCEPLQDVAVNAPYYRQQLDAMRRYQALALDNMRREPRAYLAGAAYRAVRVFFIEGSDDLHTAQQFSGSGRVYGVAKAASIALIVLCVAGIWAARRRGAALALPLLIIAYIPATLAFVLTNMRYSITVQPFMFMFVAAALVSATDAVSGGAAPPVPNRVPSTIRDTPPR